MTVLTIITAWAEWHFRRRYGPTSRLGTGSWYGRLAEWAMGQHSVGCTWTRREEAPVARTVSQTHTHTHMHTRTVSLTYTPCLSHIHTRTMSHTHTHTQLPHPVSRVACPSLERAGWHHQGTSRPPAKPMGQRVKSSPPATQPTAPSWTLGHEGPRVHAPTGNRLGGDLRGALPASMAT